MPSHGTASLITGSAALCNAFCGPFNDMFIGMFIEEFIDIFIEEFIGVFIASARVTLTVLRGR